MGNLFKSDKDKILLNQPEGRFLPEESNKRGSNNRTGIGGIRTALGGSLCLSERFSKQGPLYSVRSYPKVLEGSMQGRSGASLDLNGDGRDDLVIGAPTPR